jgi:hypothetical protein
MIQRLFIRFFASRLEAGEAEAKEMGSRVAAKIEEAGVALGGAQLQGYFMRCRDSPSDAESGVDDFLKELETQRLEDEEYRRKEEEKKDKDSE